ncbi:glycosyltransferase family 2 protein [Candidatus Woesearchaeota archaeon]|nr:glycosyltransferase family 2 protein [Candidatus Woesearchaeota archaeon]
MRKTTLSVLVPAYNEEQLIEETALGLLKELKALRHALKSFEIIICDNGSTDDTKKIAEKLCAKHNEIKCISTIRKGFGIGIRKGIEKASNEWITYAQADGEYDKSFIPRALSVIGRFDFIVASKHLNRKHRGSSMLRNILSTSFSLILKISMHVTDAGSSMMFKRDWIKRISSRLQNEDFSFQLELLYYALREDLRIKEVQISPFIRNRYSKRINVFRTTISFLCSCIKYGILWRVNRILGVQR